MYLFCASTIRGITVSWFNLLTPVQAAYVDPVAVVTPAAAAADLVLSLDLLVEAALEDAFLSSLAAEEALEVLDLSALALLV